MTPSLIVLTVLLSPVIAVGALLWRYPTKASDLSAIAWLSHRLRAARDSLVLELGAVSAAVAILLAGTSLIVAVCWPLGKVAGSLRAYIDVPIFEWMRVASSPPDSVASISSVVTDIGDRLPMAMITAVAAVLLAVLWMRRGWWIPPIVLVVAFGLQHTIQTVLQALVDGGHPPTAMGTFPSGATARVIVIFGVILYLIIATWPTLSRRWRVVGWTAIGVLAVIEGFTRVYLLKHWPSDIPGGWLFGALLLLLMLAATTALLKRPIT